MKTRKFTLHRRKQSGVMLLEALIGILIFSLGILALVGMQAIAIQLSTDARDRAEAANLASQLVGELWTNRSTLATYAYNGTGTPPGPLADWVDQVEASLSGADVNPPSVTFAPSALGANVGSETTIVVRWRRPSETSVHRFVMTAYIN